MLIMGIHGGRHDSAAVLFHDYRLVAAVHRERLTRLKGDGRGLPWESVDELCAIAGIERRNVDTVVLSRELLPDDYYRPPWCERVRQFAERGRPQKALWAWMRRLGVTDADALYDSGRLLTDQGFRPDAGTFFCHHHLSHALPALFFTDWPEALLYTADGSGDNVCYSAWHFHQNVRARDTRTPEAAGLRCRLDEIFGGEAAMTDPGRELAIDSLGWAYGFCTEALGFRRNRHEGKLTGLAASGRTTLLPAMTARFQVDPEGVISTDFAGPEAMRGFFYALAAESRREDVAASVQALLEQSLTTALQRLLDRHPARRLGVGGGVFANVRLNQHLAEHLDLDELFVVPPMGDDGVPLGGVLHYLLVRDGLYLWLSHRHRLESLQLGRDFDHAAEAHLNAQPDVVKVDDDPVAGTVTRLADGQIGGLYLGRGEYGPRALGARSIIADPARPGITERLNQRLERSDFMPFAPVVTAEDAGLIFTFPTQARYAARFMTITVPVKPEWQARIPAAVHIDGTARPQVIERAPNPVYYDILRGFTARTGVPVLINTSFNVHEEPIVNTPAEALAALRSGRVDFMTTKHGVYVLG